LFGDGCGDGCRPDSNEIAKRRKIGSSSATEIEQRSRLGGTASFDRVGADERVVDHYGNPASTTLRRTRRNLPGETV